MVDVTYKVTILNDVSFYNIIEKIKKSTPKVIKKCLKAIKINKALLYVDKLFFNKYDHELAFQQEWAKIFKTSKSKVLECLVKYRHFNEIKQICNINEKTKALDVGCGISTILHYIKGEKYGIDPLMPKYLKIYTYPNDIKTQQGYGENIPFSSEYFDVVFCSNVLDHVSDPEKTVNEIYRVLRIHGFFILHIEIFKEKKKRSLAHPFSFMKADISSLLGDKYETLFSRESPSVDLRNYVSGKHTIQHDQLTLILKKV